MAEFRPQGFQVLPVIVKNLLIINTLVFLAQYTLDDTLYVTRYLALYPVGSGVFNPYQLITYMFAHGNWPHLIFNMFALWMFGSQLENYWGSKRFVIFYLVCGIGAGICELVLSRDSIAVGASGAIMGLLASFGYLFPNSQLFIFPFPFPIKAKWAMIGLIAIDLFGGIANRPGDNIAHFAHLGGAITGIILVMIWNKTNRRKFY